MAEEENKETEIKDGDKEFLTNSNAIADEVQNTEREKLDNTMDFDYKQLEKNLTKQADAFTKIDDHYTSNLPTFMLKDFLDDKFGDHTKADAKMRFAYFMVNGIQSKLKNASNAAAMAAGKSPMFQDTQSDYDKIRSTNLYQGLENRWNKNKQSTQAAMDLAKQQGMNEQDLQHSLNLVSQNARLNNAFKMMDEKQKVYTLQVLSEMGDYIKGKDLNQITNILIGGAISGDVSAQELAAITAAKVAPGAIDKISEIYTRVKAGEKLEDVMAELFPNGINTNKPDDMNGNEQTGGPTGNNTTKPKEKVISLSDGSEVVFGKALTQQQFEDIVAKYDEVRDKYRNGEIDKETAEKDLNAMYNEMQNHKWFTTFKGRLVPPASVLKDDDKIIKKNEKEEQKNTKKRVKEMNKAYSKARNTSEGYKGFFTPENDKLYGDLEEYQKKKTEWLNSKS